jgi:hypothetical protein
MANMYSSGPAGPSVPHGGLAQHGVAVSSGANISDPNT